MKQGVCVKFCFYIFPCTEGVTVRTLLECPSESWVHTRLWLCQLFQNDCLSFEVFNWGTGKSLGEPSQDCRVAGESLERARHVIFGRPLTLWARTFRICELFVVISWTVLFETFDVRDTKRTLGRRSVFESSFRRITFSSMVVVNDTIADPFTAY